MQSCGNECDRGHRNGAGRLHDHRESFRSRSHRHRVHGKDQDLPLRRSGPHADPGPLRQVVRWSTALSIQFFRQAEQERRGAGVDRCAHGKSPYRSCPAARGGREDLGRCGKVDRQGVRLHESRSEVQGDRSQRPLGLRRHRVQLRYHRAHTGGSHSRGLHGSPQSGRERELFRGHPRSPFAHPVVRGDFSSRRSGLFRDARPMVQRLSISPTMPG